MWFAALILVALVEPKSSNVMIFAVLMGLLFWGWDLYTEYQTMKAICETPIIGAIACSAWNIITFMPKLFMLGLKIMVSFAMVWVSSFFKHLLTK